MTAQTTLARSQAATHLSHEEIQTTLQTLAEGFRKWPPAPLLHWPNEVGLDYETVTFPSEDGVVLEGWFIPKEGSNKIIVANHPRWLPRGLSLTS